MDVQDIARVTGINLRTAALAAASLVAATLAPIDPVWSGPLADGAKLAEEKAASGDTKAAYEAAREAFGAFAASLPFTIGKSLFVSEKPAAYGAYVPRANSVFKSGEALITYVELIGLTWKPTEGGKLQSNFTVDLELHDNKGATLAAEKSFGSFTFTGYVQNQEIYTHLTLDVSGAKPGDYVLRYTVNDVLGSRAALFEQGFTVSAP